MIPAILTGIKAIKAMGLKKAVAAGAKSFAKNKAKDFISGKGRKKKTDTKVGKKREGRRGYSTPGQIVVAGSTEIVPSTPMVGTLSTEVESAKVTPKKKVSIESMTLQLENIVGLTKSLEKITKKNYKNQKRLLRKSRVQREKDKKREREEKRESLVGKAFGFGLNQLKKVDDKFNIVNFFTQILLGSLALAALNNLPKIEGAFKFIGENLSKVYFGFRLVLETFKIVGRTIGRVFTKGLKLFKPKNIGNVFKSAGNLVFNAFKGIGNFFVKTANKLLRVLGIGRRGAIPPGRGGRTPRAIRRFTSPLRRRTQTLTRGIGRRIATSRIGNAAAKASWSARLATRGAVKTGSQIAVKVGDLFTKAGKLTKVAGGAVKAVAKGFSRIPIVGPLIVALGSHLAGDPIDQTLFKAFGSAIGGFLGTFVPLPGISTILGGLIGEYVGDLLYVLIRGGGPEALGKRLQEDLKKALQVGKAAADWVGDGFNRFVEGIPKWKLPDFPALLKVAFPALFLVDKLEEIPDLGWLLNPLNVMDKLSVFGKAFFSRDPMKGGSVKEAKPSAALKPGDKPERAGDFVMGEDGKLRVYDGLGTRMATEEEISLQQTGASNIDGTLPETEDHSEGEGLGGTVTTDFDFDPGQGDKSRKIFLHWTAGSHSTAYPAYHTTFLGNGKAVRATPYGQDKGSHTAGGNTNSVGLSVAAMGGAGVNENNFGSQPPTAAQLDAMTSEAAKLAYAWGWDASTVDSNVRTHGEWERYATRNGILGGPPQRWDLDKLKVSDPDIDVSKVLSSGGNKLRSMIKAKLAQLKSGKKSDEKKKPSQSEAVTPSQPEVERSSEVGEVKPIPKPKRSDFASTRAGSREYAKAMNEYRDQPKVEPQTSKVPGMSDQAKQISKEGTYTVSGVTYDVATGSAIDPPSTASEQRSPVTMDTTNKPQSAEITPPPKPSLSAGVESQAYYEGGSHMCCCDDESVSVLPPPAEPVVSGGSGGRGGGSFSGGDVLNSLLKQQVLGFLYRQG